MSEDPFDEHDPYKETTIKALLRDYTEEDMQKGGETHLLMKNKLESLTLDIWDKAQENAKDRDSKTVEEKDVLDAFNELFYPYTLLEEVAITVGEYEQELRSTAAELKQTSLEKVEDSE
jgi:histone H3/H4